MILKIVVIATMIIALECLTVVNTEYSFIQQVCTISALLQYVAIFQSGDFDRIFNLHQIGSVQAITEPM